MSPSGKSYIGQTCNPEKRQRVHKSGRSGCKAFTSAILKYGWDNFVYEVIEADLSLENANILEEFYIDKFNTLHPNGYNLTFGGSNKKHTEETKTKISAKRKGWNNPKKGISTGRTFNHTEEAKRKISENHARFNKGKKMPAGTHAKGWETRRQNKLLKEGLL